MDNNPLSVKNLAIAIGINLISSVIVIITQYFLGQNVITQQVTSWVPVLAVGIIATILYFYILKIKVDPFIELKDDFRLCLIDFKKLISYPSAIPPNPFSNKEPPLWSNYQKDVSEIINKWYSCIENKVFSDYNNIDINDLLEYSNEFIKIVQCYLQFTEGYRKIVKNYSIQQDLINKYNTYFVTDFNTLLRPKLISYINKFNKSSEKKNINVTINSAIEIIV